MKTKLIYAYYDPISKTSFVGIQRGEKLYRATAQLHPADADIASEFAGCRFAEHKAKIKMYKDIVKEKKHDLKIIEELYDRIESLNNYQFMEDSSACRFTRKQMYIRKREIREYEELIHAMEKAYQIMIENRVKICREDIPNILTDVEGQRKFRETMSHLGLNSEE